MDIIHDDQYNMPKCTPVMNEISFLFNALVKDRRVAAIIFLTLRMHSHIY